MIVELAYLLERTPAELRQLDDRDLATLVAVIEERNAAR